MSATEIVPTTITAEQQAFYRDQGYLIIPGLLNAQDVADIRAIHTEATEKARAALKPGEPVNGTLWEKEPDADGQRVLRKVDDPFVNFEAFQRILTTRKVLGVVHDLLGPELYYHSSKMMCKPPRVGRRKPWHQDYAYWDNMDPNQLTLWIAIDESTKENGCMQLIPESHKRGLIKHERLEDWQIREDGIADERVLFAEMQPGDGLFFDVLTLHASDPNNSDKRRLSAIIDYQSKPETNGRSYGRTERLLPSDA